jgi:hypothetical protein
VISTEIEEARSMAKSVYALTITLALVTGAVLMPPDIGFYAQAKDAKTPPKKDPPPKVDDCGRPISTTTTVAKAKTADKAFNAMDCYIRGRFFWWQPSPTVPQPADATSKTLAK